MKKVLHITNWYPNKWNDLEALFIKEQFDLFSEVSDSRLLHVQVRDDERWFGYEKVEYSERETGYYISTRIKTFRIIEILTTLLLLWALFRNSARQYDLLHFHIAYPLLTYYHIWKKFIKVPVIISEHWSAFHFNFYMPRETNKLDRMKNIFHQNIPVITVSEALLSDIQEFAGTKNFPSYIIPNVINQCYFEPARDREPNSVPTFFIVNNWAVIKNPFPMLEACAELHKAGEKFHLKIGGYGVLLEDIKAFVRNNNLQNSVSFLGKMKKEAIAKEMYTADAYLFTSKYETFSVVCAEALCCGCPLIGPPIAAILEYAGEDEMAVLEANDSEGWAKALGEFIETKDRFDHETIAQKARGFLSHEEIKEKYKAVIE